MISAPGLLHLDFLPCPADKVHYFLLARITGSLASSWSGSSVKLMRAGPDLALLTCKTG
jgi:hypothetical protein